MTKFFTRTKPLQLTKLLDGGLARTLVMQGVSIKAVRFDHNIMLDEGLYDMSVQNKYSTGSALAKNVTGIDGTYKYLSRDYETEKGIKYECTPRYADNREGNRKSHFVHYTSTNAIDGKRQTFIFAYSSAINAVKEILTSEYMVENYGEIIKDGANLQVRTLRERFLPTEEMTRKVFEECDSKFKLTLLCIITLYYLQKTFCFDQLEIEPYDLCCAAIIKNFNNNQNLLSDEEWEIYLTFLYLISIGKTFIKDIADPTQWVLRESSQKKFYYSLDFKPISYQNVAIGDTHLNLSSNLMRIVEDISSIIGYNTELLTTPYNSKNALVELRNIINYFIYPSLIHSNAYNDCVTELYETLYKTNDLDKVQGLEKIVSDITVDNSLVHCLAKDIVKDLYKVYPAKFSNYIKRCQIELDTPQVALSRDAVTPTDYFKTMASFKEGINYKVLANNQLEPQFINFGYTLTPYQTSYLYPQLQNVVDMTRVNWYITTKKDEMYILRNSPANFFTKSRTQFLLDSTRNSKGYILGAATYEILVEVINNIISIAFNSTWKDNFITLDANRLLSVLQSYCYAHSQSGEQGCPDRKYYIATKLMNDLCTNPNIYKVTRIVTHNTVTVDIEANLFVLSQMKDVLYEAVNDIENFAKARSILPEEYYTEDSLELYTNLIEAARQLLSFFGNHIKKYTELYHTPNELLNYEAQTNNGSYTANLWYNYEEIELFDLKRISELKEQIASKDISFLNVFQDLLNYIGHNNKGIINIQDCYITSHIEHKVIYGFTDGDIPVVQDLDVWEPHALRIKVSIPYAEYLRLKHSGMCQSKCYTLTLQENNPRVLSW